MAKKDEHFAAESVARLKREMTTGEYSGFYLFYGEEVYLRDHYLSVLRKKLTDGPMEEFNYRRLTTENCTIEAIQDAVESMPVMAERTMVQVDDFDLFPKKEEERDELIALLSDLPDYCVLVFVYDTLPYQRNGKMKKLCAAIDRYGCEVEFARQSGRELYDWIARHFRQQGKTITPDLCQYLAFVTGGDMTTLEGEIGKIAAYSHADAIVKEDVDAVTEPVLNAVLFDVTDALAAGDNAEALGKLRQILQMQEEPIAVLAAMGSHFRRVLAARVVQSSGGSVADLLRIVGSNSEYYGQKLLKQARRWDDAVCRQAVELCYQADWDLKRSMADGPEILELLILRLAQEAAR